jgi:NAD(P)-dependent dehydrogenase (short-subunit alcohol dehydrogenase family)
MSAAERGAGPPGARRTALVTGASSGIGAAIARVFGRLGWGVALGARRTDRLREVAGAVEEAGGRAFAHALDVTRSDSIDAFFAAAEAALGPVDLVVNNAGIGVPGALHELAVEDIERELATNLLGPMLVARRALPGMLARRRGDLVFISSMNVVAPRPLQGGYTAAKAGLEGVAHTLRVELEGTGVRSLIVRPGPTRSEFAYPWGGDILMHALETWKQWGFMRHNEILEGERIAEAVVAAVTAPPGTSLDVIQVNPDGSRGG